MTWEPTDTIKPKLRGACNKNAYFWIWPMDYQCCIIIGYHPSTNYSSLHETSHHVTTQPTKPCITILYLFQLLNKMFVQKKLSYVIQC